MHIRNIQYQLRRRRLDEVFDFSFLVLRDNFLVFFAYAVIIVFLFSGINFALFHLLFPENDLRTLEWPTYSHTFFAILILFEQPVFALPLIQLNGFLVFEEKPTPGTVMKNVFLVFPRYFLEVILKRTSLYSLPLVLIFLIQLVTDETWDIVFYLLLIPAFIPIWRSLIRHFFMPEVVILEKLAGKHLTHRLKNMGFRSERIFFFLSFDLILAFSFLLTSTFSWNYLLDLIGIKESFPIWEARLALYSPVTHMLIWVYALFHSTSKFLFYIDIRSLQEGWDIELLLRKGVQETDDGV